jgi:membrane-bound ClpP family serine protease
MSWLVIITIILVGFIFLLLEILVVPGTTIVGIAGFVLMIVGVFSTYTGYGSVAGTLTLGGTLIFSIVALAVAFRSNTWKKAMLNSELIGKVNIFEPEKVKPGDTGLTISRLNPMGKAMINGEYYEVTAKYSLIDHNTEIVVTKVEGNKIIVKSKSE